MKKLFFLTLFNKNNLVVLLIICIFAVGKPGRRRWTAVAAKAQKKGAAFRLHLPINKLNNNKL